MCSKRSRRAEATGSPAPRGGERCERGFTLIEILIATAIAAMLLTALGGVVGTAMDARTDANERNRLAAEARFAMERMVRAVSRTDRLLLPLPDNPGTAWSESVRDPGVLAMTLDPTLDRDGDGWADANNDRDYQDIDKDGTRDAGEPERIDEDPSGDTSNDLATGIVGLDDDNDGSIDEAHTSSGPAEDDDDEDGTANDDGWNGIDDDGDGVIDEDPKKDMSGDAIAGVAGVDDDGDGTVDEGDKNDDDEDGAVNEDWFDVVAYFLSGTKLLERFPDLDPVDGNDFTERVIAEEVTAFRVERIAGTGSDRHVIVDITLTLGSGNVTTEISTRVRVGGRR